MESSGAENGEKSRPLPYWSRNIKNSFTSIPILLCCFSAGLIDSSTFNAWGVFATMQTGNTVILGLGASQQPTGHPRAWLQAFMAILFFFLGSLFTSRVTGALKPLRHSTLTLSFLTQTSLLTIAAALVQSGIIPGIIRDGKESLLSLIILPMLSFQAAMQSVTARQFGLNEVPTTVLTSIFTDLGNDPNLFTGPTQNWKRNRRFGAVVAILTGAIIGGWLSRTPDGMPAALWLAAAIKACLTVGWVCWKSEETQEKSSDS